MNGNQESSSNTPAHRLVDSSSQLWTSSHVPSEFYARRIQPNTLSSSSNYDNYGDHGRMLMGLNPEDLGTQHDQQVMGDEYMNQMGVPSNAHLPTEVLRWEAAVEAHRAEGVWNAYLYGQSANVAKAAVWWSMFGTLVISLMQTDGAVGFTRAAFNLALVVVSPVAGAVAERASIRFLLNATTVGRMAIWSLFVPLSWVMLNNVLGLQHVFWGVFVGLMFFDGIQVAFANVVDIDCGGLETLSAQYSLPINDYIRNRFNSIHQMVFDLSFILFTPPIAFILLELSQYIPTEGDRTPLGPRPGVTALQIGVSSVFLILSLFSLWWYLVGLPKKTATSSLAFSAYGENSSTQGPASRTLYAETKERLRDVTDGFKIVLRERALGWRLLFLALETALEDSMVSVVIPEVALHTSKLFALQHEGAVANLWAVCIIAIGKVGGLLAGVYMNTRWNPPLTHQRNSSYRTLFWCVLLSSLSVGLFPLGRLLSDRQLCPPFVAGFVVFLASFLFFFFSTAPKIGFATLLQSLVASQQVAGRVFGFVGTFVTVTDAIVISLINFTFVIFGGGSESQLVALTVVAAVYLVHGLLEAIAGPLLILDPSPTPRSTFFVNQPFPMAVDPSDPRNASGFPEMKMPVIDNTLVDDDAIATTSFVMRSGRDDETANSNVWHSS